MDVSVGLERCGLADLLDRESCRDRHRHLLGDDCRGDLRYRVGLGVAADDCAGAAGRVGASGDGDDAVRCHAESQSGFDRLGAEEVDRCGDAARRAALTRPPGRGRR